MGINIEYRACVTHGFIGVFADEEENALNDWTDAHARQGFAWRPSSVSFGTGNDGGVTIVRIEVVGEVALREDAMRIIQVPFENKVEQIVVTDAVNFKEVPIHPNKYTLTFQHWWVEEVKATIEPTMWCTLSFMPSSNPPTRILKADSQITVPSSYLMNANPAY